MEYNLLICTSSKYWLAVDINEFGDCDRISLDGNERMEICSADEIPVFCSHILNYYNIEDFSDIPLNVKIVTVGNYSELIVELFEQLKSAATVNIVDAKSVIPIFALKKGSMKPGESIEAECLDEVFSFKVEADCTVSFEEEHPAKKRISLEAEEFALLYRFDCTNLLSDEKEKKELEEKYQKEVAEKEKELLEQKEAYKKLQEKYRKLEEEYAKYKQSIVEAEDALNAKRTVVWVDGFEVFNI